MESIELCQCFASLGDSKNAHLACYYRSTEYDSGIILSYDENEAVTGETGQRTKLGGGLFQLTHGGEGGWEVNLKRSQG